MIKKKELLKTLQGLIVKSEKEEYVTGRGILTGRSVGFSKSKLEKVRPEIESMLREMGIDMSPLTSLEKFTKLKDGTVWNDLSTMDDFKTLDLLLAVSNACEFIINDDMVLQLNIGEMGEIASILIAPSVNRGYEIFGLDDEKWLNRIKESVIGHMYFLTSFKDQAEKEPEEQTSEEKYTM